MTRTRKTETDPLLNYLPRFYNAFEDLSGVTFKLDGGDVDISGWDIEDTLPDTPDGNRDYSVAEFGWYEVTIWYDVKGEWEGWKMIFDCHETAPVECVQWRDSIPEIIDVGIRLDRQCEIKLLQQVMQYLDPEFTNVELTPGQIAHYYTMLGMLDDCGELLAKSLKKPHRTLSSVVFEVS